MKILGVDAGNTRIKWGVRDGAGWAAHGALPTVEAHRLSEALATLTSIDRVVVANVAGEHVRAALAAALAALPSPYWVVGVAEQCGVRSSYADPGQLGP